MGWRMAEGPYHEPEAQKKLAGGETTGCREHPASPGHRAPEGAREAFDSGVAFTSLLAPFRGAAYGTLMGTACPVVAPPANVLRASGSTGERID